MLAFLVPLVALVRSPHKPIVVPLDDKDDDGSGIRCPVCGWQPGRHHLWSCHPGCGHAWNTFSTGGTCPQCQKHWAKTQCIKCGVWSEHDAWYRTEPRA